MKETDALKQYTALRDSITKERENVITRLREIDEAIGFAGLRGKESYGPARPGASRVHNELSLKETVLKVLEGKSLTKHEILDVVMATGYQFTTADPINSLGVVLYGKNPKFQKNGKRFGLKPSKVSPPQAA